MQRLLPALLALALAACNAAPRASEPTLPSEALFNGKDLTGFYTFLSTSGKNNDPNHFFKVENGMLHIMDLPETETVQETGYLATEKEYGNFDLRFDYKWGTKRWAPRRNLPRDSGCHYFLIGPDKIWANALECQIQEGETGDLYNLNSAFTFKTTVKSPTDRQKAYLPADQGGSESSQPLSLLLRRQTADSPTDWNHVEIIVRGNSSTHIVNGTVVNHVENVTTRAGVPVTQGKIAFQSEAAEMWYRNIEIRPLK